MEPTKRVRLGTVEYDWRECRTLDAIGSDHWAHHDIAALPGGGFVTGVPAGNAIAFLNDDQVDPKLLPSTETHGMSVDADGRTFSLWVADPGRKSVPAPDGRRIVLERGRVLRFSPSGELEQEIPAAAAPAEYREWRPTKVVAADIAGDDRVWVADGYGHSVVHCFSRAGEHLWAINGSETGVRFSTPHTIIVDRRRRPAQLLVADRGNRRIVAYSLDGTFIGSIGEGILSSPSGLAFNGADLWITELFGGLVCLNGEHELRFAFGDRRRSNDPDWPNRSEDGSIVRPLVRAGTFHSPHGIAIDQDGRVAITEWMIGGRLIVLTPRS